MEALPCAEEKAPARTATASCGTHRVLMWAPPRTLSTCLERAYIEHTEIHVQHEPFGTPFYWSEEAQSARESKSGTKPVTYASVAESVFLSAPPPGRRYIFSKNLSYYVAPHCLEHLARWQAQAEAAGDTVTHCFMMRHPAKAISSLYFKSVIDNEKTGYTHFDAVEAGFEQLWQLLCHLERKGAPPPTIIDADDLLEDPQGVMKAFSTAVGLPFKESMLSWAAGPVKELESPFSGWTEDVQKSTGIKRREKRSPPPSILTLPIEVQACIARAMVVYQKMSSRRLRAGGIIGDLDEERNVAEVLDVRAPVSRLGVAILLASIGLWVLNAELLQHAYTPEWEKPFCQGLMLKGSWSIMLVAWCGARRWQRIFEDEITFRKPLRITPTTVFLSIILMFLTQAASVTWIISLPRTPVSANMAIYQINPLLVYAFSIPLLNESLSYYKLAVVLLALFGALLVANGRLEDISRASTYATWDAWGYVLVTISTIIFSLKEVLFKRFFPSLSLSPTPLTDAMLCVGIIGVGSIIFLPVSLFALHITGIETFVLPPIHLLWSYGLVALTMAMYQTCVLCAIALTSPTFVSTGSILGIPGAMVWDYLELGHVESFLSVCGIGVITVAFVLLVVFSHGGEQDVKDCVYDLSQIRKKGIENSFTMAMASCGRIAERCVGRIAGTPAKQFDLV
ncbi:hypothetical protein AB1Y20_016633 [Prymnesium parvum]|uniref:EamA domain-containing protein n=1 Tax=Prymnesium parvum TaxID=97485 RepID=A0AB34IDA9_PRYPA